MKKRQMTVEIQSGCAIGPSLCRGKEALNDKAVDKARATISCRRSSIAMEVAGGEAGVSDGVVAEEYINPFPTYVNSSDVTRIGDLSLRD